MLIVTNKQFIETIFGGDAEYCHVTDFTYDPNAIPPERQLSAWMGGYFRDYRFTPKSNQYFTISTFAADAEGKARRRKNLFKQTHCIVLDDVKEKLVQQEVDKLPAPSWILRTSSGSEQWGYILTQPCKDRHRVENLLDGLIANGLAPDGRDSGMKGVTRYVRLPEGYNNKSNKLVNGQPFKCELTTWNPFNRVTLEQLAAPLNVDLDALRREQRVDGAVDVPDHPIFEHLHVKESRNDGRFIIRCPWVHEHTNQVDDNGTAVFTNPDGTIGFKCHHGHCEHKTGKDLLEHIESEHAGFKTNLSFWQLNHNLDAAGIEPSKPVIKGDVPVASNLPEPEILPTTEIDPVANMLVELKKLPFQSPEFRQKLNDTLKAVDNLPALDRSQVHDDIMTLMRWSKAHLNNVLKELRNDWYAANEVNFFDDVVFISELNVFYDRQKNIFYTPESYQNSYSHLDPEARKTALQGGRVQKTDKLDFAPNMPPIFEENGITYANTWHKEKLPLGKEGDPSPWLDHFDRLGWSKYKEHILQFMAYTILHPENKINHILLFGSSEGSGKDFILYPLIKAMANQSKTIDGSALFREFNDYLLNTKHLQINEIEAEDKQRAKVIGVKLKPLGAAPPDTLRVNQKNVKEIDIRNIVSVTGTCNTPTPVELNGPSRRLGAFWSDFDVRNPDLTLPKEWQDFFMGMWHWMKNGGAEICIWYLRNCVDLSGFNHGAPAPVTDFLRDMVNASKSPLLLTIEAQVVQELGVFKYDLLTADDIHQALCVSEEINRYNIFVNTSRVTPSSIHSCLSNSYHYKTFRTPKGVIFALRNVMKYRNMTLDEVAAEYEAKIPNNDIVVVTQDNKVVSFKT